MPDQPLEDLLDRLERERQTADRVYNDALTALDRAIQSPPVLPAAPTAHDVSPVPSATLDGAADSRPRGLRALLWRVLGPPPDRSAELARWLVDRANRSIDAERRLRETLTALLDVTRRESAALITFESLLINYLQTITAYVDTRDRRFGSDDLRDRLALAEQRLTLLKREIESQAARGIPAPASGALPTTGGAAVTSAVDSATYVGFEDRFRGAQAEIRRRVEDYVPLFEGASNVLDVGCGRGRAP